MVNTTLYTIELWMHLGGECGGILSSSSGIISSPKYPENYPPWSNCTWSFVLQTARVRIEFLDFELEDDMQCFFDAVTIYYANSSDYSATIFKPLCGDKLPPSYELQAARLMVRFKSDKSVQGKGFLLRYQSLVPPSFLETPVNKTVQEGQSVQLKCSAVPSETTITWSKDGEVIQGGNFAHLTAGLRVLRASRENMGWYVCNATNRGVSKVARVYLRVLRAREAGKFKTVPFTTFLYRRTRGAD
ncbi:hypothetical protein ACROYT_G008820 [Oculina patagonica]